MTLVDAPPDAPPDVSVVICTHDRTDDLAASLPGVIASCEASPLRCEIVVVDNAPSDGSTRQLLEPTRCRYVLEESKGLGNARNIGVHAADGDVVLFVDDDVDVPVNWVDELAAPLLSGSCDLVAGAILPGEGRTQPWMGEHFRSTLLHMPEEGRPGHLIGASFGCHRRVLRIISFDPQLGAGSPYGSGEDVFFYEQAKEAGFVTLGSCRAPVHHNFDLLRLRRKALEKTAAAIGRSEGYVARHWLHSDLRFLRLRIALDWARVWIHRLGSPRGGVGISDAEFRRRIALSCKRQLLRESRVPARYSRRGTQFVPTVTDPVPRV